jgi:hypothetical protein
MANYELNVKINGVEQSVSTIGQLEQALTDTNTELQGVAQNSSAFTELNTQASQITGTFNQVVSEATDLNTQLNNIGDSATKLGDATTETMKMSQELSDATTSATKLDEGIRKTATTSGSLRAELRKITQELQGLEPGTERFSQLSQRAGELRDQIADTQGVVTALAGNTTERLGRALGSTIQIGVAGFQGLSAVTALFGVEAEKLEPTMVRLQALLNLSQAIETFGSLPDKITEITAAFNSLTTATETANAATNASTIATSAEATATTAATTATTAAALANNSNSIANQADAAASLEDAAAKTVEATATTAAAGATTALGIAMKALPIVAIAAAVGTLVYGIYQYVSATGEATKEDEERKKAAEELVREQENERKSIADSSGEYALLITRLKQTTAGSKEREKLIKQINAEYGTTLQNLKDENSFQQQLNLSVTDYIALQTIKYKLDKGQEKFNKLLSEQETLQSRLFNAQLQYNAAQTALNKNTQGAYYLEIENRDRLLKAYEDAKAAVDANKNSIDALGLSSTQLLAEKEKLMQIFKGPDTNKNTGDTHKNTLAVKELTAAEEFLLEIKRQRASLANDEAVTRTKATKTLLDDLDQERIQELLTIKDRYEAAIKADEEEVKSKKKKKSEKESIDKEYDNFLKEIDGMYKLRIEKQAADERLIRIGLLEELRKENDILQQEIIFGDQNTQDTYEALAQRRLALKMQEIDEELKNNQLSQEEYETLLQGKSELQATYLANDARIQLQIARSNVTLEFENYKKYLQDKLDTTININEQTIQENKRLESESLSSFGERLVAQGVLQAKRDGETDTAYQERLANEAQAYENLTQTKINLEENYAVQVEEINANKNTAVKNNDIKTQEEIFAKRLQILRTFFAVADENIKLLGQGTNIAFSTFLTSTITAIDSFFELSQTKFESTTEKVAAYAAAIGGALNSIISGFVAANQAALEQDLQNFEIASNERKDQLAREYNSGLINREQYDKGVKAADDKLKAEQLKARKEAFEQDKKLRISQAVIAGLQGAVSAFAGAMQLGPIAGPIVGGILAALVATTTAINIAQISKQKFDSGGTTVALNEASTPSVNTTSTVQQASQGGFTGFSENAMGTPQNQTGSTGFTSGNQRVYVLESDITATQDRVRVLESNSTFG